jgi:SAM-dependent methyltransferase/uncharacterized protein YbaR (Trm112 family)
MVDVYKIIACPICKSKLDRPEGKLLCETHGEFLISPRGIPILFKDKNDQTFLDGEITYKDEDRNKKIVFLKKKLFRKPKMYFGESLHDKLRKKYIENSAKDSIILNIGSGHEQSFEQDNFVNFDIYPHWNTNVAGDAHYLPFLDNSVDIVWLCAVLEHIQNPFMVMEEVYRVLKPAGKVLISVPFIQYLHASPHDYFRYTKYGLRSICLKFKEIESGASYTGPMGTLLQLITVFPHIFFKNKLLKNFSSFLFSWLFSPLLLLDLLSNKKNNEIITGGICYLGEKDVR